MSTNSETRKAKPGWYSKLSKYSRPDPRKAIWQLFDTFIPYIALWILMVYLLQSGYSYWTVLLTAALAGLFLIRIFIFFHDCCHGSFFASRRVNKIIGYISGIMTFTPYEEWRGSHAKHHLTAGDLDRRGTGDVWTMTLDEYLNESRAKRLHYRIYRNPLVMFGLGPAIIFLISYRFIHKNITRVERNSVIITNLSILAVIIIASLTIGLRAYLMIQLPTFLFAGVIGVWIFYVQHQFEGVYWARHDAWDPITAALEGASCYKLPKILQWFTGNIGFHHIHHVMPTIPNYNLQRCYHEIPAFQKVKPLTVRRSLKSLRMNLWDEKKQKLVSFHSLRKRSR